ncbi:cytochrome P450 [Nemania abortiva]|nr:cytochrome P450 [Nemania abortiva]
MMEKVSWTQAALVAAGLALLCYIVSAAVAWYKLRHIPGPFFASFSYIWTSRAAFSGHIHSIMAAAHSKYGETMRIGPDAIVVSDAETLLRINSARSPYVRSPWYGSLRLDHRGKNVLSELDITTHSKRKAKLAPGFSGKNVTMLEARVDEWIGVLIRNIRARIAKGGDIMDIGTVIAYFQVDLVSSVELGKAWGDLEDDTDHFGFLEMSDAFVPIVQSLSFSPAARAIYTSTWFMKLFGPKTTDTSGLGLFIGLLEKEVKSRFNDKTGKSHESEDILGEWMKHGLSESECQQDLSLLVPAGSETSVMVVRGTLLLLMSSPVVYRKLKEQIKDAIASGLISSPATNEEAKSLEYMQAVVREGMRLMAPVNFGFPKRVPASGDTICGKYVPPGTDVYGNYFRMMRSKEIFGNDAEIFRPERFLGDGENVREMVKVVDLAFGGGRFMCLGKSLAVIELNKIFIELLRNFDFQIATPEKPWGKRGYISWMVHDFWARVTEDTTMR